MTTSQPETDLFTKYLEICNRALKENKDRFPFKQILGAAQSRSEKRKIKVCVIGNGANTKYLINIHDNEIHASIYNHNDEKHYSGLWNADQSYLEDVVNNPEDYIHNPAKLNWDWMYEHTDFQDI